MRIVSADLFTADEDEKEENTLPSETRTDLEASLPDATKSCQTDDLHPVQRSPHMGPDARWTSWNRAAAPPLRPAGGLGFPVSTQQPLLVQVGHQQPPSLLFSLRHLHIRAENGSGSLIFGSCRSEHVESLYIGRIIKAGPLGLCRHQDLLGLSHFRSFLLYPHSSFSAAPFHFLVPSPQHRLDHEVCPSQNFCFSSPFLPTSAPSAGGVE